MRQRLGSIAALSFAALFLIFVLAPSGVRNVARTLRPADVERRDTSLLAQRTQNAERSLTSADADLREARGRLATALMLTPIESPPPDVVQRRDSLGALSSSLDRLIARAEAAPLAESYRALGAAAALRDDPRVRALLDSLSDVEAERESIGAGSAVDPIFMALTTRATTIGRAIQSVAESRRATLRREVAASRPVRVAAVIDSATLPDTLAPARARVAAQATFDATQRTLAGARTANAALDSARISQREATRLAPPLVLVGAALVIALAVGFSMTLADEMRSPRVSEIAEAERLTGARVVGVVAPRRIPQDRNRRSADQELSPLLDPTRDAYRILAWHVSALGPANGIVTLTGDVPAIVGTVASNLAAVFATEARATLLVDADFEHQPIASVLRVPVAPGLSAVLARRREWPEVLVPVSAGRDRTFDVLPSGAFRKPPGPAESEALADDIRRMARRYDVTATVAPLAAVRRLRASSDVLICAHLTRTRLATIARTAAALRTDGARVIGIVLWDGDAPDLLPPLLAAPSGLPRGATRRHPEREMADA